MNASFIIYAEMESLLEKIDTRHSNPKMASTTKINKHTASGYCIFTHSQFDATKNKHDYYRGKDCMKKISNDLKKHATKIIMKKKDMMPLINKKNISHRKQNICYICQKKKKKKKKK